MSRVLMLRAALIAGLVALAVLASWLIPRVMAPPDRFTVALRLIEDDRAGEAVHLFEDIAWRGVAEYRAGRYHRALNAFIMGEGADDLYNVGNAYARLHTWGAARSAYLRALRLDPDHADARFNLNLIERAQEAERKLEEAMRDKRRAGRWEDGDRLDDERGGEMGENVETGGADKGALKASDERTGKSGKSDKPGRLGEKPVSDDPESGASGGTADGTPPEGLEATEGQALIRMESSQAAEILLRRIRDNPGLVLRARLRALHRARQNAGGACDGC